jgi:dienelactone hydrolase
MKLLSSVTVAAVLICFALTPDGHTEPANPPRLDRTNLFSYHRDGKIVQGKTKSDWNKRRGEVIAAMQEVMGPLPGKEKRCPLDIRIEEEVDCGSYVRRLISYQAEPNGRVPAYLLIPKQTLEKNKPTRGVLCLHPTDMSDGNKTVVGLGKKENRGYARELAERGFVTIAPPYPIMAGYNPDLKALGYQSGTMKAIWNNMRALDVLESLPYVKRGRFAAIGHSLGGHNAIYTAVFDPRIAVIVSSCGFDSYVDYKNGDITGWTQERYMPRLAIYSSALDRIPFDFHEMVAALAPRPFFVNAPMGDKNFQWQSVDRILSSAKNVYNVYGADNKIHVEHPECPHDFPEEIRNKAYAFINAQWPK